MSTFFILLGLIGFLAGIVYLIINIRKRKKKKYPIILLLFSFVFFIIGGAFVDDVNSDKASQDSVTKNEEQKAKTSAEKAEQKKKEAKQKEKAMEKKKAIEKKKEEKKLKAEKEAKQKEKDALDKKKKKEQEAKKKAEKLAKEKAKKKAQEKAEKEKKAKKEKKKNSGNNETNRMIAEDLKQSQGFATGKLDRNGNETKNGTPNPDFNWSTFVEKITVENKSSIDVQVTASFSNLSDADKNEVASKCQNVAIANLGTTERPSAYFYLNGNAVGHSKVLDQNEFKWY
ncbi:hypothetical protein ACYRFT_12750 [Listeria kieliensis]